jgi:sigma54-dependent transcription regulator
MYCKGHKVKRQPTEMGENIVNSSSGRGFIARMIKELKKTSHQFKNGPMI